MNSSYSVLVCSCDEYEDLWIPFFTFLKKNWPIIAEKQIYLNTESKSFSFDGLDIQTFQLYLNKQVPAWSERLMAHLKKIDTDFILLLLDDFFIEQPVVVDIVDSSVVYMQRKREIVNIGFVPTLWSCIDDKQIPGFEKRKVITPFRVNCQAGIWRRKELLSLLRKHETPWDFEVYGSIRSRWHLGKFYVAKENAAPPINYDWYSGGAIHRGKWTPHAIELLKQHNIKVDISARGIDDHPVQHPDDLPRDPKEDRFWGRISIRLKVIKEHWRSLI